MVDQTSDVFDEVKDPAPVSDTDDANNQNPAQDPFADQLGTILREDGTPKFTDVAQALESIPHADKHIKTLESELKEARETLAREQAAKELLQKSAIKEPGQATLTAEQVAEIATRTMAEREAADKQTANVDLVRAQFSKQYGDKAGEEMSRVASSSGMTKAQLKALSASSPQAVLKLAGIKVENTPVQKTPYTAGNDLPSPQPKPAQPKSVMAGANTKEMIEGWRAAGERIKQT